MRGNHSHQQTHERAAPSTTNSRSAVAAFVRAGSAGTMPHSCALNRPERARLARPGAHNMQTSTPMMKKSDCKNQNSFSTTACPQKVPRDSRTSSVCARNACARQAHRLRCWNEFWRHTNRPFDAYASSRLCATESRPERVAQTAGARRWMRPTPASVGALERARVNVMAVELMGMLSAVETSLTPRTEKSGRNFGMRLPPAESYGVCYSNVVPSKCRTASGARLPVLE